MPPTAADPTRCSSNFDGGELTPFFAVLHRLLGDLRLIEDWVETTLSLPPSISRDEMIAVAELAYIIRHGQSRTNFDEVTLELDPERYEPFKKGVPGPLRIVLPLAVNLFGRELPIGHLVGELAASDVKVAHVTAPEGADRPVWLVRLEPATEEARHPVFRFEREHPEATRRGPAG